MDEVGVAVQKMEHEGPMYMRVAPDMLVTVPFSYQLRVTSEDVLGYARDPIGLVILAEGLEAFWHRFAHAFLDDGEPWKQLLLVHPRDIAAGFDSGDQGPVPRICRPQFPVATALAQGNDEVAVPGQVWATMVSFQDLGVDDVTWDFDQDKGNVSARRRRIRAEFRLDEAQCWVGSLRTKGSGSISIDLASLVIATAALLGGQTYVEEGYRTIQISERIAGLGASPCYIKGLITLDRRELVEKALTLLTRKDRVGTCARQEMLVGIGLYPGPVDGIEGPETLAALETFRTQWGIPQPAPGKPTYSLAFSTAAMKALQGKKPGG